MGTDWGDDEGKDWGGSETHDWGVPLAPASTPPDPDASLSYDPLGEPSGTDSDVATETPAQSAVFVAMNNWKHSSHSTDSEEDGLTEHVLESGDATICAIEDGKDHYMIGRAVGEDADRCVYCLVGRVPIGEFQDLYDGEVRLEAAFDDARDISLSSVFHDDKVTNVVLVERYKRIEEVPSEYRPPSPFLRFTDE